MTKHNLVISEGRIWKSEKSIARVTGIFNPKFQVWITDTLLTNRSPHFCKKKKKKWMEFSLWQGWTSSHQTKFHIYYIWVSEAMWYNWLVKYSSLYSRNVVKISLWTNFGYISQFHPLTAVPFPISQWHVSVLCINMPVQTICQSFFFFKF